MSISKQVQEQIQRTKPGSIFGIKDFENLNNSQAVALELSRLSKKGQITRLTKGKYYVPETSRFGTLGPSEWQILDNIIKENGGYFAGTMALNRIGVTTQIPATITIRGARSTRNLKIGFLTVKLYRQGNRGANYKDSKITDIIESIRLIKKTPDGTSEKTISRVSEILKSFSESEIIQLTSLIKNERPYVRAILGALFDDLGISGSQEIKNSLNPLTAYKLGFEKRLIPNMETWGIF